MYEPTSLSHRRVCCHLQPLDPPPVAKVSSWLQLLNSPENNHDPVDYYIEKRRIRLDREQDPDFSAAAVKWPDFAGLYWDTLKPQINSLFTTASSLNFVRWAVEYARQKNPDMYQSSDASANTIHLTDRLCDGTISPLHMAALLGIPGLCQDLLSKGASVQQNSPLGTPLYCAFVGPAVLTTEAKPTSWKDVFQYETTRDRAFAISHLLDAGADCKFRYQVTGGADTMDIDEDDILKMSEPSLAGLAFWAASIGDDLSIFDRIVRGGAAMDENLLLLLYNASHLLLCSPKLALQRALIRLLEFTMEPSSEISTLMEDSLHVIIERNLRNFHLDVELKSAPGRLKHIADEDYPLIVRSTITESQTLCLQRLTSDPRFDPNLPAAPYASEGTVGHLAVSGDNPEAVDILIKAGADFSARDGQGRTPLMVTEKASLLELLVKKHCLKTTDVDDDGRTIWHYAAATNDGSLMEWLCDNDPWKEFNIKAKTISYRTPLNEALNHVETLKTEPAKDSPRGPVALRRLLIEMRNCSLQAPSGLAAHLGLGWGLRAVFDELMAVGADFEAEDADGNTLLHLLNLSATPSLVRRLREMFPKLPVGNNKGETPAETIFFNTTLCLRIENDILHTSAHPACVCKLNEGMFLELLTPEVIHYRAPDRRGTWERFCDMALEVLIDVERSSEPARDLMFDSLVTGLNCLITRGAMEEHERRRKTTALYCFQSYHSTGDPVWDVERNATFLLRIVCHSQLDLVVQFCQTPHAYQLLLEAWDAKEYEIIAELATGGALPLHLPHPVLYNRSFIEVVLTGNGNPGPPSVYLRALFGGRHMKALLLAQDAEIFQVLFRPSTRSRIQKLEVLLHMGLNPKANYLPAAIMSGNYDIASALLKHQAGSSIGLGGLNALIAAAAMSNMSIMSQIIEKLENMSRFDWNCFYKNIQGITYNALQMAAHHGHDRILLLLLEKTPLKHSVNSVTPYNASTPAHLAAAKGSIDCLHILEARRADLTLVDEQGRTPLQVAIDYGYDNVVGFLRSLKNTELHNSPAIHGRHSSQ